MKLVKNVTKKGTNLYIVKNFRDLSGKSTSKIIEKLGHLDDLQKTLGDIDVFEWAKARVDELTRKEEEDCRTVMAPMSPTKQIKKDVRQSCNCGYLFLKQIYYRLGMDKICTAINQKYKYDYDLNQVLELLVMGRIIFPGSKLSTVESGKEFLEGYDPDTQHVYRALDVLDSNSDYIQKRLFLNSNKAMGRDTTIIYYDCTNYFFEIEQPDPEFIMRKGKLEPGLRQKGVSKEHRPNPVVQMGMFVDANGIPIAFSINKGNTNEQTTLCPTEQKLIDGMKIKRVVVCTDGGLSSEENRRFNSIEQRSFITVQSMKKLPEYLQNDVMVPQGWKLLGGDGKKYDLSQEGMADKFYDKIFYRERWIKNDKTGFEQRMIVTFSFKYRAFLRNSRQSQIEKATSLAQRNAKPGKNSNSPEKYLTTEYATAEGELAVFRTMSVNLDAVQEDERFDGFYAICTDLESSATEIIKLNHNRWESEDAFRVLKSDFRARPTCVYTAPHIRAHFLTCFIALVIFRIFEKELQNQFTSAQLLRTLRTMSFNIIRGEGYKPNYMRTDITDAMHKMAGFRTDTEIVTNKKIKQIMKKIKG